MEKAAELLAKLLIEQIDFDLSQKNKGRIKQIKPYGKIREFFIE